MLLRTWLVLLAVLAAPAAAGAVTVRDLIELTKAGLPEEVLIAVIDADRTIFTLDAAQIVELKKAGVSKAVLLKMLRSRREFDREPATTVTSPVVAETTSASAPSAANAPVAAAAIPEVLVIGKEPPRAYYVTDVPRYYFVPFPLWGIPVAPDPRIPPAPFLGPEHRGFGRFINDGWIGKP